MAEEFRNLIIPSFLLAAHDFHLFSINVVFNNHHWFQIILFSNDNK